MKSKTPRRWLDDGTWATRAENNSRVGGSNAPSDPRERQRQLIRGDRLDKVIRMYRGDGAVKGMSARKIAAVIGVSDSTIRQTLSDAGISLRYRGILTPAKQDLACEMYVSGSTYEVVARELGCCPEVIRDRLHKNQIPMRPKVKLGMETHAEILAANDSGVVPAATAKRFGVHRNTIVNVIKRFGGHVRGHRDDVHRTIPLNTAAFANDSEASQYWIGFIMTDGGVDKNGTFL